MNTVTKLVLLALTIFVAYDAWHRIAASPALSLETAKIIMYGPENDPAIQTAKELLKFKGLSCSLIPINAWADVQALKIADNLKDAGMVGPNGDVSLPFFTVGGKFVKSEKFFTSLEKLPFTDIVESRDPYIIVYGVQGCSFTFSKLRELDDNKLRYEFRDVNDPRYRPRFDALLRAHKVSDYKWPIMDVSGHFLTTNPSIEQIREWYR